MIRRLLCVVGIATAAVPNFAAADDQRAHVNYMLHCQGCHLPQAEGVAGTVPPMKDFVGFFLHSEEGRNFLIRIPGVSRSALDDAEIAELMNWLLLTHSREQLPDPFRPFTTDEVAELREDPEGDPNKARAAILASIASDFPSLEIKLSQDR